MALRVPLNLSGMIRTFRADPLVSWEARRKKRLAECNCAAVLTALGFVSEGIKSCEAERGPKVRVVEIEVNFGV